MSVVTRIDDRTGAVSIKRSPEERRKSRETYFRSHLPEIVASLQATVKRQEQRISQLEKRLEAYEGKV